ncbi:hypothetical protein CVT26_006137 [Gymnopilus dilepis]|uniref:Uncharacterized protein n=1 Tax=Gymnopilus dilepis TaxID=231916 RepID=A0A409YKL6_9AGAR|nr:hypothetical protein CVT26_006137 [Gymnopilus dilepis]
MCSRTNEVYENVVYHLGTDALERSSHSKKSLTPLAASRWKVFSQAKAKKVIAKETPLKICIPGGKFEEKGSNNEKID